MPEQKAHSRALDQGPETDEKTPIDEALDVLHGWWLERGDGEPNVRWWDHNRTQLTRLFDALAERGWEVSRVHF